ncbi:hypothetical protein CC2G_002391 [Coprinopsis cinerea AmutBmut pab1-1]|nr:hypothetical protein CC2G_002391 [Coprinopsis cinerea AmutBmut pab1-1]
MTSRRPPATATNAVANNDYPTPNYTLDDEQLLAISSSLVLDSPADMQPQRTSNLDDVPEEDGSTTEGANSTGSGPYGNPSAANSSSTFHQGQGGGSGTSTPTIPPQIIAPGPGHQPSSSSSSTSSSRARKAPSVRTLGRPSNDHLQPGSSGGGGGSGTVRRTASSASSKAGRSSSSAHHQLNRYRSTPRLPHDKDIAPAPATGMYWSKAPVWGTLPSRTLRAHTATLIDNTAWILGGSDDKDISKDIYCFDTETLQWTHPDTLGEAPPPCRAHTATLIDKKIVMYGGGIGSIYYDAVYILDTTTRTWTRPHILDGPQPTGRRAHTAVYYKNKVWVFGGGNGLMALNDVWTLDLGPGQNGYPDSDGKRGLRWEEQHTTGKKPGPRGYHSASLKGNTMVVVGGSDGKECFTDIWLLNLDTLAWTICKPQPQQPLYKRLSHSATQVGSYLFLIAGHNGQEYCSEILFLNLVSLQFEPRIIYGKPPSIRGNHATVLADSRIFLFGGFNGQMSFDDVHILDLAAGAYLPQVTEFEINAIGNGL